MANERDCRQELSRWFGAAVTADVEVMKECLQICSNYNLSGETLFFQWEAFSYNNVASTPSAGKSRSIQGLTLEGAKSLRAHVARETAKANEKKNANTRARGGALALNAARTRLGGTPHRSAHSQSITPRHDQIAPPVACFGVKFTGPSAEENIKRTYRYMFEKISTRSEVLDDRIDEFSELIREEYGIEELGDPSSVTEDVVTIVGRLCLDPDADAVASSSKLSPTTLVLEASRMGGSGERVPLKFEPDFGIRGSQDVSSGKSLFPGEILALRGRNGGGGWFSVNEILPIPLVSPSPEVSTRPLSVSLASGPYTTEQNLDFAPFLSIIEDAKSSRPSVLIILGPFIDASHASVKSSKLPMAPLALFQQCFLNPILSLIQHNPGTLVLLVPHVRDLLNSHVVFPQGVGEGDFGQLPTSVKVLPNPCLFSLNGIRFGVSTVDVLYHLKNQQYTQRPQQLPIDASNSVVPPAQQDVMANLCRHVLEQRSFYPIFPVPVELSLDINLDVSHSDQLKLSGPAPDVLVLPSILRQFSKNVEGTLVINPSVFAKSRVVARLHIPAGAGSEGKICDSTKVDLTRLS
ncbi:DNA polymerase alpha/epsilon subunit B-domain-containing protein [Gautieria morchelliformis]|nr:DNA polymerase alpha/epsilon subunit B-domain-containing protein [Gautieria morchelliformis]